jgi:hypothetical protein
MFTNQQRIQYMTAYRRYRQKVGVIPFPAIFLTIPALLPRIALAQNGLIDPPVRTIFASLMPNNPRREFTATCMCLDLSQFGFTILIFSFALFVQLLSLLAIYKHRVFALPLDGSAGGQSRLSQDKKTETPTTEHSKSSSFSINNLYGGFYLVSTAKRIICITVLLYQACFQIPGVKQCQPHCPAG